MTTTRARKVVLTIEVMTELSYKELQQVQALVFGTVRRKVGGGEKVRGTRQTIRREIPKWAGHDVRGVIEQVQVNVVDKRKGKKKQDAEALA